MPLLSKILCRGFQISARSSARRVFPTTMLLRDLSTGDNNNKGIFTRAREMAKKYVLTYTISYGALSWVSIGGIFASLHYQIVDPAIIHGSVVSVVDFVEQIIGPSESMTELKKSPELGFTGNLALALVADSCLAPLKMMATVPIVTQIEAMKQARRN